MQMAWDPTQIRNLKNKREISNMQAVKTVTFL